MAPRRCLVCHSQDSKYSCPSCLTPYCSVACFAEHKSKSCLSARGAQPSLDEGDLIRPHLDREEDLPDDQPLIPLTSLKWPYIPEESAHLDPLKRDDPKTLQLRQYEGIATSSEVRSALSMNPTLPALLQKLDKLRGTEREEALERLLGVTKDRSIMQSGYHRRRTMPEAQDAEEDTKGLTQLAEAIEKSVRAGKPDVLGLDWTEDG